MDLVPREYKKINNSFADSTRKSRLVFPGISLLKNKSVFRIWDASVFILLILLLACFGGLKFYQKSLVSQASEIEKQYNGIIAGQDKSLVEQVLGLEEGADLLESLLKSKPVYSKLFDALSVITLPSVQWTSFNLAEGENQVALRGLAANYTALAKQMLAFQKEADWKSAEVSGIALDKVGRVGFNLILAFDKEIILNND